MPMKTPLHDSHVDAGARMVDFAGWAMPIQYRSQLDEHRAVRERAGVFDVSHMAVTDVTGSAAGDWLRHLLCNDVERLRGAGRALYTCMLDHDGGVLDDLIVYRREDGRFRMVLNAARREADLAWLREQAPGGVEVVWREDLAMLAVQGPDAVALAAPLLPATLAGATELPGFAALEHGDWMVARTGYTGEDGFEVMLPATEAPAFWRRLVDTGVRPCGLGARDSLRLEAGLNLYGQDMDTGVTPLECALGWTVAWQPESRRFIGRDALERQRAQGVRSRLVGLVLEQRGVMRAGQRLSDGACEGVVTSGGYSPVLGRSIALARVDADFAHRGEVIIRERACPVRVVRPPFVRHGEAAVETG